MMLWRKRCVALEIAVSDEQAAAMDELETRGFYFCAHFGTHNAVEILAGMNRAMDLGILYEWLAENLGVVTGGG